jgi:hypothetical protein
MFVNVNKERQAAITLKLVGQNSCIEVAQKESIARNR